MWQVLIINQLIAQVHRVSYVDTKGLIALLRGDFYVPTCEYIKTL